MHHSVCTDTATTFEPSVADWRELMQTQEQESQEVDSEQHSPTPTGLSLNHSFPVTIVRMLNKNALTCFCLVLHR